MHKHHIIIGSVILVLFTFLGFKFATFDPRPAVVQAAEEELQELLPRFRQAEAEYNALKAEKERNEKTLKDYHYSFDEETLRAVEGELPLAEGSVSPKETPQTREKPRYLVIHHTDIADRAQQLWLVEAAHERRGYPESGIRQDFGSDAPGFHIAYHYFIGKDGTVVQTRLHDERTQHTACGLGLEKCKGTPDVNDHSLAIVLAGNFEHEQPTKQQLVALRTLVRGLDDEYHFQKIMTHRDASPTSCPGDNLVNAIQDLLRDDKWNVTRYYSPLPGQSRYYADRTHREDVKMNCGLYTPEQLAAFRKQGRKVTADGMLDDGTYGDCFHVADGSRLKPEDAFKVAACPPEMPFGTRLKIEGIGEVVCRDRGSAIKNKKIDVWSGIGNVGLQNIYDTKGGLMSVRILPPK